jgi:hypothetical protein
MMVINNKFEIGETVYQTTDPNQFPRIITRFCVNPEGVITYEIFSGSISSWHYAFELSREKNTILTTTN